MYTGKKMQLNKYMSAKKTDKNIAAVHEIPTALKWNTEPGDQSIAKGLDADFPSVSYYV